MKHERLYGVMHTRGMTYGVPYCIRKTADAVLHAMRFSGYSELKEAGWVLVQIDIKEVQL